MGLAESITLLEIHPSPGYKAPPEYPPQALVELYRAADAFVLSSLLEGFSTALLEAKAAGLPIVATRVTGIVDQVEDGVDGILVDVGSPVSLALAMAHLRENPSIRQAMADVVQIKARYFSWEKLASDYLRIYQGMCPSTLSE
jgi:glycosyltransferase involved in cell wall biosynthesis